MNQDAFSSELMPVVVPDAGTGGEPIRFVTWLVPENARVIPGERLAELLVQGIILQIEAEIEGVLEERVAQPGEMLFPGESLGLIRIAEQSAP